MAKVNVTKLWTGTIAILKQYTPVALRWAIGILDDVFQQRQSGMDQNAANEEITASSPEELKQILQNVFDLLNSYLANRPFVLSVVQALETYLMNNLVDAVFTFLFQNDGTKTAAQCAAIHYQPKCCEDLEKDLAAAVALSA
jgi:hypothetical protein